MPTFTFDNTIPASNNSPSADQPKMLINNVSTDAILEIDHVSFNSVDGGTHKQVTFSSENVPGAIADPQSVLYTDVGIEAPTHPQLFWKNSQATFPVSCIRAFGSFNPFNGVVTAIAEYNLVSITGSVSGTTYTIPLTTNSVNGNDIVCLIFQSDTNTHNLRYTFTNPTLVIRDVRLAGGTVNFVIIQV